MATTYIVYPYCMPSSPSTTATSIRTSNANSIVHQGLDIKPFYRLSIGKAHRNTADLVNSPAAATAKRKLNGNRAKRCMVLQPNRTYPHIPAYYISGTQLYIKSSCKILGSISESYHSNCAFPTDHGRLHVCALY